MARIEKRKHVSYYFLSIFLSFVVQAIGTFRTLELIEKFVKSFPKFRRNGIGSQKRGVKFVYV